MAVEIIAAGAGPLGSASVGSTGGLVGAQLVSEAPVTPSGTFGVANAAAALTITGVAGQRVRLSHLAGSYSGAAPSVTNPGLQVTDGVTTLFYIFAQAIGGQAIPLPPGGLAFAVGATVTVTILAGGAGVVGSVNAGTVIA